MSRLFKLLPCGLFSLCLIIAPALQAEAVHAAWNYKIAEKKRLAKPLGLYRKTEFNRGADNFVSHSVVIRGLSRYQAKVVDQGDKQPPFASVVDIATRHGALTAINGGYFLPNFKPAGLFILEGEKQSPLSRQASLSGVLSIDRKGKIEILTRQDELARSFYAIQAGPFLIDPGGNMGIKSQGKEHRRTVIGLTKNKNIFLISTTPVSLFTLATLLKEKPRAFGIRNVDRALNLDGGPSTALFVKLNGTDNVAIPEQLAVRNFVLIRE